MSLRLPLAILFSCVLAITPAGAATHVVTQSGLNFVPANLTISIGDTVQWVWTTGIHTVTNGTGALDPEVGTLFDEPLSTSSTTVSFTFNETGVIPYFCRPHESLGMIGSITVEGVSDVPVGLAEGGVALLPNVPNPFNPRTLVRFETTSNRTVRLAIHDLAGRRVRLLEGGREYGSGVHEIPWDGRDDSGATTAAGVYIAVLETAGESQSRALVLIK